MNYLCGKFIAPNNINMLTRTVKISNVTNLSDARYCAGMGVEMLGFSIDQDSPHYIAPKKFEEICSWLAGVQLVAESSQSDPQLLLKTLAEYPVHYVQVEAPGLLTYLQSELNLPLILRVSVDTYDANDIYSILSRYGDEVAYFLLESDANTALSEDWIAVLTQLAKEYPILIGFGLDDENTVNQLTETFPEIGIALRGSEEIRPGYKDFGSMMDILEALEEE
jgi:phosphoribosylanthranilate isomerase